MMPSELVTALGQRNSLRVVHRRTGHVYDVHRDVILARISDDRPYIYGWPVATTWRTRGRVRWFYAASVEPVTDTPPMK